MFIYVKLEEIVNKAVTDATSKVERWFVSNLANHGGDKYLSMLWDEKVEEAKKDGFSISYSIEGDLDNHNIVAKMELFKDDVSVSKDEITISLKIG